MTYNIKRGLYEAHCTMGNTMFSSAVIRAGDVFMVVRSVPASSEYIRYFDVITCRGTESVITTFDAFKRSTRMIA